VSEIQAAARILGQNHPESREHFAALASRAILDKTPARDFNAQLLAALPGIRPAVLMTAESLGMSRRDIQHYSLTRAIQSVIRNGRSDPDGLEGEVHRAMMTGNRSLQISGFLVPFDIGIHTSERRDLNVTTAGQGGNFVQTTILTPIIELLRNR